ncbi:MAG: DUF2808 domain-containing protein [Cyanobacteria bacterium J06641_5]
MPTPKRNFLPAIALAGYLAGATVPTLPALAQGTGLTLFSGVRREFLLPHSFDFDAGQGARDRYRMRIPAKKLRYAASSIVLTYPAYYKGKIDTERTEVRIGKRDRESVALESVSEPELLVYGEPDSESKENDDVYRMEILLVDTIPENTSVEIVLNVRNPRIGQTYYFNARVQPPRDIVERYIGTWIVSIDTD